MYAYIQHVKLYYIPVEYFIYPLPYHNHNLFSFPIFCKLYLYIFSYTRELLPKAIDITL